MFKSLDSTYKSDQNIFNESSIDAVADELDDDGSIAYDNEVNKGLSSSKPISFKSKSILVGDDSIIVGSTFQSREDAIEAVKQYGKTAVVSSTSKKGVYLSVRCFRYGKSKESISPEERQRNKISKRCDCKFELKLKLIKETALYSVYSICNVHNHEAFTDKELKALPQNRFIPEEVKEEIIDLYNLRRLESSEIMLLIEKIHFPEVEITWNLRDVQNLIQKQQNRNMEAADFIKLLEKKVEENPEYYMRKGIDNESLRLSKVFWMSPAGKRFLLEYNDVLELDATYKTNRFGMPLVITTGVDQNGITIIIAVALISNESEESYRWILHHLKSNLVSGHPAVLFTDGDPQLERAIQSEFPDTTHLLCRWHIGQNILKALAGILGKRLSDFTDDFWRVVSIEDITEYNIEFQNLFTKWPTCNAYLNVLKAKEKKWAFAHTHNHFVAGIASTQRQESANFHFKKDLIQNSTLSDLVLSFNRLQGRVSKRIVNETLRTKLTLHSTADPMISEVVPELSRYAAQILIEECTLSLSYMVVDQIQDAIHSF